MALGFKSLLDGARKLALGGDGGDEEHRAASTDDLFQRTTPEVDGDDCIHDCDSCTVRYPRNFKIEESDLLYGHIKGWSTHVLVATGKSDWVREVADEKGSIMQAIDRAEKPENGVCFFYFDFSFLCPVAFSRVPRCILDQLCLTRRDA